jgi:hypothetical protein
MQTTPSSPVTTLAPHVICLANHAGVTMAMQMEILKRGWDQR